MGKIIVLSCILKPTTAWGHHSILPPIVEASGRRDTPRRPATSDGVRANPSPRSLNDDRRPGSEPPGSMHGFGSEQDGVSACDVLSCILKPTTAWGHHSILPPIVEASGRRDTPRRPATSDGVRANPSPRSLNDDRPGSDTPRRPATSDGVRSYPLPRSLNDDRRPGSEPPGSMHGFGSEQDGVSACDDEELMRRTLRTGDRVWVQSVAFGELPTAGNMQP